MLWNSRSIPLVAALLSTTIAVPAAKAQGVLGGGFLGSYTQGTNGGAGAFQRRDARIDFNWQGQGPGGSVSPEFQTAGWSGFSGLWSGSVIPSTSETYT